jgi:hypothetical protein
MPSARPLYLCSRAECVAAYYLAHLSGEARGVRILRILTTELSFARDHLIKGNARLI